MKTMNRRQILGGLAAFAAGFSVLKTTHAAECSSEEGKCKKMKTWKNEEFYKADGTFDAAKAKEAYYELMKHFNYPIYDRLKTDEFWVLDFGLGRFTEVGMAGIFWINREDGYLGHDIWLLPNQMIAEHYHVGTDKVKPKMEGWQPRYGWVYLYGEGEETPGARDRLPEIHRAHLTALKEQKVMTGDVGYLAGPEQRHSMLAGDEGAIVTEYATYHDFDALRFTHPDIKL